MLMYDVIIRVYVVHIRTYSHTYAPSATNIHAMFLGKVTLDFSEEVNWEIHRIIGKYVYRMYNGFISQRDGVG